jgi:NADH-quinone oxidoreductase subunit L
MMVTTGVGAAMFHLTTHAFFKALLFLGSGSVIAGCHHEQNIFKMGGLKKRMPVTFWTFTFGVAAIVGLPYLSGFFSKDAILYLAFQKNTAVFAILTVTAVLTSFYMIRMWKLTFFGDARSPESEHAHESGWTMTLPLALLAVLSVFGGYTGFFAKIAGSLAEMRPEAHGSAHTMMLLLSIGILALGGGAAWYFYKSSDKDSLATKSPSVFGGLALLKSSPDLIYNYYVAKMQDRFALVLNFLDQNLLGGLIIRGLAGTVGLIGMGARALYVGNLHAYVYWFLFGAALVWGFAAGIF